MLRARAPRVRHRSDVGRNFPPWGGDGARAVVERDRRGERPLRARAEARGRGSWKEALDHFKRAAAVKRTPQIEFHLGLSESRSGDLVSAIVDLQRAAASAREKGASDVESAASTELADARSRAPTLEIDAPADRVQRVVVDGSAVSSAMLGSPFPMNPGDHVVAIEFAGGRAEKKVSLAERDAKKVALDAPAAATAMPGAAPVATGTDATSANATPPSDTGVSGGSGRSGGSSNHTVPLVLLIGGGALVAGGAVFFILRQGEISDLNSACPSTHNCDPSLESDASSGKTYTTVSYLLGGVGIAAAAVGAGMLLFGGSPSKESAMLVPSALPGGGGATIVGRF